MNQLFKRFKLLILSTWMVLCLTLCMISLTYELWDNKGIRQGHERSFQPYPYEYDGSSGWLVSVFKSKFRDPYCILFSSFRIVPSHRQLCIIAPHVKSYSSIHWWNFNIYVLLKICVIRLVYIYIYIVASYLQASGSRSWKLSVYLVCIL